MSACRKLGQHFLIDKNIINKIISVIPNDNYNFIEIGPGYGALTYKLLDKNLTCLEVDPRFPKIESVKWITQNALNYSFNTNDYLISNLPYNIASQILQLCIYTKIIGWTFMMQKEMADRILAISGKKYGRLSLLMQSQYQIKKICDVSPECFSPKPKVFSTVLQGTKKSSMCCVQKLEKVTRDLFIYRRKCIDNIPNSHLLDIIKQLNINTRLRPENLSPTIIWEIVNVF